VDLTPLRLRFAAAPADNRVVELGRSPREQAIALGLAAIVSLIVLLGLGLS
jgi:hypothetical protein